MVIVSLNRVGKAMESNLAKASKVSSELAG